VEFDFPKGFVFEQQKGATLARQKRMGAFQKAPEEPLYHPISA
jgi:hypothetical protein